MYSKYFVLRYHQIHCIQLDCEHVWLIFIICTSDYSEIYKDIILVKSNFIARQNECDK